jgi:hypothetical protein
MNMLLSRCLRTLAIAACLFMAVSFVLFGIDQAGGASDKAQSLVNASGAQTVGPAVHHPGDPAVRRAIDDVNHVLAAPFRPLVPDPSSAWGTHGIEILGGLLLYGLGLGALARAAALTRLPKHEHHDRFADAKF